MKNRKRALIRTAAAALMAVLTGCFLLAGLPVLAANAAVSAHASNASPIAENLNYSTFRNIAVKGRFAAVDPEGEAVIYEIAGLPKHGTVQTEKDGSFVYTPNDSRKGSDTFAYIAIDSDGNISEKAVVSITINKQATNIAYSDMTGNGSYYAALLLAEKGILTGEKLGGSYFFRPDMPVTRGEFLAMCLAMNDTKTLPGITRTGFYDDASIPQWVKPYVSTALMSGIITGFKNSDGRLVFASQAPVTFSEAAVILNNLLKITDAATMVSSSTAACPAWSQQAERNLEACRILTPAEVRSCSGYVTRAEAADMLATSMDILKTRNSSHSLLDWLR